MRASVDAVIGDESASAIPVSPVKIDLEAFRTPLFTRADRLRFVASLALCVGLHAAILFWLEPRPQVTQVEEAIPVEVIIEPPPEEAEPETAKAEEPPPEKPAQTIEEQPATDFARAADQDREDGKASEPPSAEVKEPEPAQPEQQASIEPPPPAPDSAPELVPEPVPEPNPQPPPVVAKPAPRFAGLTPLPDFKFKEPPAKRSDFPSGTAAPGYLSTLYGRIMHKMPPMQKPLRPARGRVTFGVMSNGRIFQEAIAIPSGEPFLDAAALNAVRKAAPFPPPPKGGPVYIRFDYGSN